ncbi:MAG: hypothetical protein LBR19_10095 [Bifidobacteriaceae bacterium]|jgi:hypothetical protein|nr:hypothetical protein [Bifidobacteriaceae bacterium]
MAKRRILPVPEALRPLVTLLSLILGLAAAVLLIWGMAHFFASHQRLNQWVISGGLFLLIAAIQCWVLRVTLGESWAYAATVMVAVTFFLAAVLGLATDALGNDLFNFPLESYYAPQGDLVFSKTVNNYAPGEFAINYDLYLVTPQGEEQRLSGFILYGYRLFQYLALYLFTGFVTLVLGRRLAKQAAEAATAGRD